MIKGLNIFLPTRARPTRLAKFLQSMQANADDISRLFVVFVVDQEDHKTLEVIDSECSMVGYQILINSLPKPHLARFYNRCYAQTKKSSDEWAVSMFGDDMVFASTGFDRAFIDALNKYKGKAIVYGDDDYLQHGRLPVHLVTSRPFVRATKELFMCERFRADMIDTVWSMVGKGTKTLKYLKDVHIRHEHNGRLLPAHRDSTWKRLQTVKPARGPAYVTVGRVASRIIKNLKESKYV